MSGTTTTPVAATSLTGTEIVTITTTAGVVETTTISQIAAQVALQVAINLATIVEQVTTLINTDSGVGIDLSAATVTPGNAGSQATLASLIAGLLPIAGGTMTGALSLSQLPIQPAHATNKGYVDNAISSLSGNVSVEVETATAAAASALAASESAASAALNAIAAARDANGGIAGLDGDGGLILSGTTVLLTDNGLLVLPTNFPTEDPGVVGALWDNGDYICRSKGSAS